MFWNDLRLTSWASENVTPFDPALINPASIDLRLGEFVRYPTALGWGVKSAIDDEGLTLGPGQFVLLHTLEVTAIPTNAAALLFLKSSTGRRGLEHLHAGYGDPGFCGQWTLEVINHWPYPQTIFPGERLFQLCLVDCAIPAASYGKVGHYQHQRGPTAPWGSGGAT